jgi:hypothetical protein
MQGDTNKKINYGGSGKKQEICVLTKGEERKCKDRK